MKKILSILLPILLFAGTICAITAEEILAKVDENMNAGTVKSTARMIVETRRATRTMSSVSYAKGTDTAFTEYTAPAREKGTKMLKIKDDLWLYNPSTDRVIQISGNMLKQSVMGSDLSYEDFMEEIELAEAYIATMLEDKIYDERRCYVLDLMAKTENLAYSRRVIYVDKERMVPLYQELYAKSGKKLKTMRLSKVTKIKGRWYPLQVVFKDELKSGNGTTMIIDEISFDIDIPDHYFTKAVLRK
ncbi:MAG: outer membrane lipoprotein-sorting protein [Candidatus Cloacimonadaceae bacterium]|jgi:outer membrane lipoprotein-sorting protein|nr:outer membrane lipoprotein-sorting protein [Candidatus Cloacimonadota bacterium]MDY0126660.1 outer membrane lipoprotein-sorting protein [Candidatus Cloacimonadaceae bacterium]MCB5255554.1 outer membrane lipoprotein-sorting protein [Candidatus Cloacimonadota bacterium]MCK9177382.1 outer membrane lipoprotein-sorting protein [Candidatus Cloacimonadota bacterium]MCK9241821.1 outer membrane lipoprotein-sorting protein [Candidatus Cloacimonadota bacterium]